MRPKDYIKEFNLNKGWKKESQEEFLQKLSSDFLILIEVHRALNNIKGFENALNELRMKWDSISNKIPYGLPEGMWRYFFATVIAPIREELCPAEMKRRKEENERRRKEFEEKKQWKEQQEKMFSEWREREAFSFYEKLCAAILKVSKCPIEAFKYFDLSVKSSVDEVMEAFRSKVILYHPDRGGSQEKFIEAVENKNKCINWISSCK